MKPDAHHLGTCPKCGYRVTVSVPRGTEGVRLCRKHYIYYGSEKVICEGTRMIRKEDMPSESV